MMAYVVADSASRDAVRRSNSTGAGAMPQSSFLGIGILIGLLAGTVVGIEIGNLTLGIGGGLLIGGGAGFAADFVRARLRGDR
jgi:hypothetical protein